MLPTAVCTNYYTDQVKDLGQGDSDLDHDRLGSVVHGPSEGVIVHPQSSVQSLFVCHRQGVRFVA